MTTLNEENRKEYRRKYYQAHKCELDVRHKIYVKKHRKQIRAYKKAYNELYNRTWRENHKQAIKEYNIRYRRKHRQETQAYNKRYTETHKEIIKKRSRQYYRSDARKRHRNAYNRRRRKADIAFRLMQNIRAKIPTEIRRGRKGGRTIELLGCSIARLKQYLEKQFTEGMSWNNYGLHGWHIDHKKPCASFDLSNPAEQRKCFHYSNLQPLWAADNYKKSDKELS